MSHRRLVAVAIGLLGAFAGVNAAPAQPLGTAFTYQGELTSGGMPASAPHDLRFRLYDAATGGAQVGATLCVPTLVPVEGRFTATLDFGAAFTGAQRFLEVEVRASQGLTCDNGSQFVVLGPRQAITAAPSALHALSAGSAANAVQFNGQGASFYQNASNLSEGTIPSGRLLGEYSAFLNLSNPGNRFVGMFTGTGAGLTGLDASGLSTGTIAIQRLPIPFHLTGVNPTCIVSGINSSNADFSAGVCGISNAITGITYGVFGRSTSTSGTGVYGEATSTGGVAIGVQGRTASNIGRGMLGVSENVSGPGLGVYGLSYGDNGTGLYGWAISPTGINQGVQGVSSSPDGRGVFGVVNSPTGLTYGGSFRSDSSGGIGVSGIVPSGTGSTIGGSFQSASSSGRGVYGLASALSGTSYGVYGQSNATTGRGVYGSATSAAGVNYGVYGESGGGPGSAAVYGEHTATTGLVYGGRFHARSVAPFFDPNTGYGVYATAGAFGVHGESFNSLGTSYGVFGRSAGRSGAGVYGLATDTLTSNNDGVYGESRGSNGRGVAGFVTHATGPTYGVHGVSASTSGRGVYGVATATSGTIYGVYGQASTAAGGFAVYADGDMGASGLKPFRIDHPDDPENKYLFHYSTESPEVLNSYSGTVTLDETGEAVVQLPHYFAKINKDPRYTLTAVGAPMPMLHVASEIDQDALSAGAAEEPGVAAPLCSFRIAGGAAGERVSWEVKAVRNDRWARHGGAPVEVEKLGPERGTYQHPELYGQPRDKAMDRPETRP